MFTHNYISSKGLENLKNYKYHGCDDSILAAFLKPFWEASAKLLPPWLAPNTITVLGLIGIVVPYFLLVLFPQFEHISYVLAGIGLFYYQTMDALDGKQARNTGNSSPLGELFDHGCDALTTIFMGATIAMTLQMPADYVSLAVIFGSYAVFYAAQWEEYFTGQLYLGPLSVIEIHFITIGLYFTSAIFGDHFWLTDLGPFRLQVVPVVVLGVGTYITLFNNAKTVCKMQLQGKAPGGMIQPLPMVVLLGSGVIWAIFSPSRVYENNFAFFIFAFGFQFALLTGKLIVCRVCEERYPLFHFNLVFVVIPALLVIVAPQLIVTIENLMLVFLLMISVLMHLHFIRNIIRQMCQHLKIRTFHVKPITKNH